MYFCDITLSGPGVVRNAVREAGSDASMNEIAEIIKKTAFKVLFADKVGKREERIKALDIEALIEEFKDKKNSEISSLRQQIIDLQRRSSQFDEMRKANIVLNEEKEDRKSVV